MKDKELLDLNKLVKQKSHDFGLDMTVDVISFSKPIEIQVGVVGLGTCTFKDKKALSFINDPTVQLAEQYGVSKQHLLAFYAANNDQLQRCQSLTKKGSRCSRSITQVINNINEFVPTEVYLCFQHEEHGFLK
jgi:hypothetical protein